VLRTNFRLKKRPLTTKKQLVRDKVIVPKVRTSQSK
jgi:hypothetical protein